MNNFQLSQQADPNKLFLVKHSELEGRFDPHFYKSEFKNIENKINLCDFDTYKLKDLFEINRGGSPRPINKYFTKDDNGVNWIKIGDTKGINKYIQSTKQKIKPEGVKHSRMVFKGDFILSNSMSFGKPFIVDIIGCIHDGWLLLRPITNKADKNYLHTVLGTSFVYNLFKKQTIGGVVENLNIDLVKNIKIPIPPKNIQDEIVAKMDNAYQTKQNKEQQAQKLLNSIDDYLLGELEIDLPKETDNSLQARIFTKKLSDITGGRFDAEYYQEKYTNFENSLIEKGEHVFLKELLQMLESGSRPTGGVGNIENGILSFGGTHVSSDGYIDTSKAKYIPAEYHLKHLSTATKINDLLLVKDGATTGKIAIIQKPEHENQNINEHVFLMRLKAIVNPIYLLSYLKSSFGNMQITREITGATVTGLTKDVVNNIKIPLPPIEKQNQIAKHISQIRDQAKQLQAEAKAELIQAKKEIETIILGGEL